MEQVKNTFKEQFKNWEIELPEQLEYYGIVQKAGWNIRYILEEKNETETVIHISASHRMTNTRNFTINQNGEIENIINGDTGFSYDPKIPGDEERKKELFYTRNRKVSAIHRMMGIGKNLRTKDITSKISFNKYVKTKSFSSINEIYHPNYQIKIILNQLTFNSLSQFYHYWRLIFSDNTKEAISLVQNIQSEIDFETGTTISKPFLNTTREISKNTSFKKDKWEENKLRILLWGSILKFTQNKYIQDEILKYYEHKFIFENNHKYWGNKSNVLGYILTQTCYDIYYLNWEEPE